MLSLVTTEAHLKQVHGKKTCSGSKSQPNIQTAKKLEIKEGKQEPPSFIGNCHRGPKSTNIWIHFCEISFLSRWTPNFRDSGGPTSTENPVIQ